MARAVRLVRDLTEDMGGRGLRLPHFGCEGDWEEAGAEGGG